MLGQVAAGTTVRQTIATPALKYVVVVEVMRWSWSCPVLRPAPLSRPSWILQSTANRTGETDTSGRRSHVLQSLPKRMNNVQHVSLA